LLRFVAFAVGSNEREREREGGGREGEREENSL